MRWGGTPTRQAKADSHSRDAAFAPLRLDCGLRPLADSPSRGGVILERLMQASYHSPLEGESQKPSRQAKADAVGGWTPARQTAARGFAALSKSTPTGAGGGF